MDILQWLNQMDKSTSEYHTNQLQMEQWISNSHAEPNSVSPNQHKVLSGLKEWN